MKREMKREVCEVCGAPLISVVEGELMRCPVDGLYHHERPKRTIASLKALPKAEVTTESSFGLSEDQLVFIDRVSQKLTPLQGLNPTARARALKIREQFRKELTNVFLGKQEFTKWYDQTRTKLGLHNTTFMQLLYECLEGLKSTECQNLRQEYENALRQMQRTG